MNKTEQSKQARRLDLANVQTLISQTLKHRAFIILYSANHSLYIV